MASLPQEIPTPIDMVMDHKNIEYLSTTKLLTHCQVCWLEFLCQLNLTICFCPGVSSVKYLHMALKAM